jgi:hypothetical protein
MKVNVMLNLQVKESRVSLDIRIHFWMGEHTTQVRLMLQKSYGYITEVAAFIVYRIVIVDMENHWGILMAYVGKYHAWLNGFKIASIRDSQLDNGVVQFNYRLHCVYLNFLMGQLLDEPNIFDSCNHALTVYPTVHCEYLQRLTPS